VRQRGWPNPPEAERHGFHRHWPNMRGWLPSIAHVVIVLLRQRNDQLKIGLSWMGVHILSLVTNEVVSPECIGELVPLLRA
jgi:hypothetical protein